MGYESVSLGMLSSSSLTESLLSLHIGFQSERRRQNDRSVRGRTAEKSRLQEVNLQPRRGRAADASREVFGRDRATPGRPEVGRRRRRRNEATRW